ncbi:MAG: hypothetical protein ACK4VW_05580 [Anaerolineales bacterium]
MLGRQAIRHFLGEIPFVADLHWMLRQRHRPRREHFSLERLRHALPRARRVVEPFVPKARPGRKVLFFATLHYWIEYSAFVSLVLAALGHRVTLMTLPYAEWHQRVDKFTQRQRLLHTRQILAALEPLVAHQPLPDLNYLPALPARLQEAIEAVTYWDMQYTLMQDEILPDSPERRALFDLRLERNTLAARAALGWIERQCPQVVLIPNGLILEMGAVFRAAQFAGVPTITFEFNDQREQIWLAYNSPIMQQDTDPFWPLWREQPLTEEMYQRLADLENARRGARVWGKSQRLWQYVSAQGGEVIRRQLGLDARPLVVLAANVLGDSLTLGRDLFAPSMSEWLRRTVRYFAEKPQVQLVIRVHPGEKLVPQAKSMAAVVHEAIPDLPEHIHLVQATDPVNTYDLLEIADLALTYTTTVGLEAAMNGVPVIVCGKTHYRGRGFTFDPNSWEEYFALLDRILASPMDFRLNEAQRASAWTYAYHFFFDYPKPFPWRLLHFWEDLKIWPLERVLGQEGRALFEDTFARLVGQQPILNN